MNKPEKITQVLALLVAFFPAFLLGYWIIKYSVNIPFWDQWQIGYYLIKTAQGHLTFEDLMAQNNEHRLLFPRLFFIALGYGTGWDVRYEMLATLLMACLIAGNIFYLSRITVNGNQLKLLFLAFLANLLIFSPMASDNWLMGIQLVAFIPMACITSCIIIIYSNLNPKIKFFLCVVLCTITTFSFANGLLGWLIILPFWMLSTKSSMFKPKTPKWVVTGWLGFWVMNVTLYFYDYHKPSYHPSFKEALIHPFQALKYFFSFLGAPLGFGRLKASLLVGILLVGLFVLSWAYFLKFRQNQSLVYRLAPWLAIGSYSVLSATITTAGRVGFGVTQSLSSRYVTFSLYLGVAVIALITIILQDAEIQGLFTKKRLYLILFTLLTVFFLALSFLSFKHGVLMMAQVKQDRLYGKACLLLVNLLTEEKCIESKIYPIFEDAKKRANELNQIGFLSPALADNSIFQIEAEKASQKNSSYGIFEKLIRVDEIKYQAEGWAILPENHKPADAVILTYEKQNTSPIPFAVASVDKPRPDLINVLPQANYASSGWSLSFWGSRLPAEATQISAWAFDTNTGKAYKLEGKFSLPMS